MLNNSFVTYIIGICLGLLVGISTTQAYLQHKYTFINQENWRCSEAILTDSEQTCTTYKLMKEQKK